jgi:anti-sigma factor RsiW
LSDCPDDSTLAELVDGRLAALERAAIVEHLGDCAECVALLAAAVRAQSALARRPAPGSRRGGFGSAAALAAPRL